LLPVDQICGARWLGINIGFGCAFEELIGQNIQAQSVASYYGGNDKVLHFCFFKYVAIYFHANGWQHPLFENDLFLIRTFLLLRSER
jgi:hypothetical protein